jgi:predicted dehydrogenase
MHPWEQLADPLSVPPIAWGFLGAGRIASVVADDVLAHTRQRLMAVASRTPERTRAFAGRFGIPRAYDSVDELLADDDIDAIYVNTPNSDHFASTKAALLAGKHVLVEKSFTLNRGQAQTLIELAAQRNLFLMEAMWTRFLPHQMRLRQMVADGEFGDVVTACADFGARNEMDAEDRFYSPDLGGGSLLDRGVYSVSWIVDLLGLPGEVQASGLLTQTGVDAHVAATLRYPARDAVAVAMSSIVAETPQIAWLAGTRARALVEPPFWRPSSLVIERGSDGGTTHIEVAVPGTGYQFEFAEAAFRIANGETSSPVMPPEQTVAIMGLLDAIRTQLGVHFPSE